MAGIDAALLANVLVMQDEIMADQTERLRFVPQVEAMKALIEQQTAVVTDLQDPKKDRMVRIVWEKDCEMVASDCSDDCEIGGDTPEADSKDVEITQCKTVGFTVKEKAFRTSSLDFQKTMAKKMLTAAKSLDNIIAQAAIAAMEANLGQNLLTTGIGTVAGDNTFIPPSSWGLSLMSYFQRVAIQNRFGNPWLLSGSNLYDAVQNAKWDSGNADGKGDAARAGAMKLYFDLFNVDAVNTPDLKTYMVDGGALAFASKIYYPTLQSYDFGKRFSVASRNLPGVRYDVHTEEKCNANDVEFNVSLFAYFDFFTGNEGCQANNTGLLGFTNACFVD